MNLRIIVRGKDKPRVKNVQVSSQTTIQDLIRDHLQSTTFTNAVLVVGPQYSLNLPEKKNKPASEIVVAT